MEALTVWFEFGVALALIAFAGGSLTRYGDVIADQTRLGETFVGLFLVAIVTSLPELIIGASAVVLADAVDIAVGALIGSCVFNLGLIVILDFMLSGESVYTRVSRDHVLSAGFGIILIGVVGFNVLVAGQGMTLTVGHMGLYSPIILLVYMVAIRSIYRTQRERNREVEEPDLPIAPIELRAAALRFGFAAAVVIATGAWLPFVGERLAEVMGVHETFVGTLLIAFATSLPEMVVTLSAIRIGALNLAVGNLFGSNLFNILILVPEDFLFTKGPILSSVSPLHAISAMSAVVMTGVAVAGLAYRPRNRGVRRLGWTSMFLLVIYLLNSYVVYLYAR